MREIKYFIDLKAKETFISQFFIKDTQLFKDISFLLQVQIVNNCIIVLYKMQELSIAIVNSKEIRKSNCFKFYVINIQEYEIILELFYLEEINLNIK